MCIGNKTTHHKSTVCIFINFKLVIYSMYDVINQLKYKTPIPHGFVLKLKKKKKNNEKLPPFL